MFAIVGCLFGVLWLLFLRASCLVAAGLCFGCGLMFVVIWNLVLLNSVVVVLLFGLL